MLDKITKHQNKILVILLGLACLPMLALAPQSGDGGEMIKVAAYGGKLHPPGFPGQVWFMKAFAGIFMSLFSNFGDIVSSSLALSVFSLLGYLGSLWFLLKSFDLLGVSSFPKVFAVLSFAFFPAIWKLGLQPEVFAWCFFVMALSHYLCLRALVLEEKHWQWMVLVLVGAWAYTIHPIAVTQYASLLGAFVLLYCKPPDRFAWSKFSKFFIAALLLFPLVLMAIYSSLLVESKAIWPNWGELSSIGDLVKHGLRAEYGVLKLASSQGSFNGLITFFTDALKFWHLQIPLLAMGIGVVFSSFWLRKGHPFYGLASQLKVRIFAISLLGSFFLSLLFLHISNLGGIAHNALPTLERFQGTALLPACLLLGIGWQGLWSQLHKFQTHLIVVGCLLVAFMAYQVFPQAYLQKDNTTEVFSRALGISLPKGAVYIGLSDVETTMGATTDEGVVYPIKFGLLTTNWYINNVASKFENRIRINRSDTMNSLIKRAYDRGLTVVTIDKRRFDDVKIVSRLQGTFFTASQDITTDKGWIIAQTAINMCDAIVDLNALPASGHVFSRTIRNVMSRAYNGAEFTFRDLGNKAAMDVAIRIKNGLLESKDAGTWREGCALLQTMFKKK